MRTGKKKAALHFFERGVAKVLKHYVSFDSYSYSGDNTRIVLNIIYVNH